jgi:hypothetical protein
MAATTEAIPREETVALNEHRCGDVLAPIPGERWTCVAVAGHGVESHIAEDGTRW